VSAVFVNTTWALFMPQKQWKCNLCIWTNLCI